MPIRLAEPKAQTGERQPEGRHRDQHTVISNSCPTVNRDVLCTLRNPTTRGPALNGTPLARPCTFARYARSIRGMRPCRRRPSGCAACTSPDVLRQGPHRLTSSRTSPNVVDWLHLWFVEIANNRRNVTVLLGNMEPASGLEPPTC